MITRHQNSHVLSVGYAPLAHRDSMKTGILPLAVPLVSGPQGVAIVKAIEVIGVCGVRRG